MSKENSNYENPEEFDPDRWMTKTRDPRKLFSSLPFGFGPRMCPGRRIAEFEIHYLIANIIRKANIRYGEGEKEPGELFNLVMIPDRDCRLLFCPI